MGVVARSYPRDACRVVPDGGAGLQRRTPTGAQYSVVLDLIAPILANGLYDIGLAGLNNKQAPNERGHVYVTSDSSQRGTEAHQPLGTDAKAQYRHPARVWAHDGQAR